jgi:V-type H+-transporting ATPase S1 subunit
LPPRGDEQRFSDAYDCISFFTMPIWSGILVTIMLLLILSCGLGMIVDIKVMDRFDDPKGKTISISNTD